MRKSLLVGLLACLAVNANAKTTKYEPSCEESKFDGKLHCSVRAYGADVYDTPVLRTVAFGGIWVGPEKDLIGLTLKLGYMGSHLADISFNVDGEITKFKIYHTKLNAKDVVVKTPDAFDSTGIVYIPIDYLEKLLASKTAKYQVMTVSEGARIGSFYFSKTGEATRPVEALGNLIKKVREYQPTKP